MSDHGLDNNHIAGEANDGGNDLGAINEDGGAVNSNHPHEDVMAAGSNSNEAIAEQQTTQQQPPPLPSMVSISQNNLIVTNDGAMYVMVRPPLHGNLLTSVTQNLGTPSILPPAFSPHGGGGDSSYFAQQQPAPPLDGLPVPDDNSGPATTVAATFPQHSIPASSSSSSARKNKRTKYTLDTNNLHPLPVQQQQQQQQQGLSSTTPKLETNSTTTATHGFLQQPMGGGSTGGRVYSLFLEADSQSLSQFQCLARKQIQVFDATPDDIQTTAQGRNRPIALSQVGIRCRHCYHLPAKERNTGSVYFPTKLDGVYQTAQKMINHHLLKSCPFIPVETRKRLQELKEHKSSDGGGKNYWAQGMQSLGVVVTTGGGLSFAA